MSQPRSWVLVVFAVVPAARGDEPPSPLREPRPRAVLDRTDFSYPNIALAFSPDGKRLASGGHPSTLKLWNVAAGALLVDYAKGDEAKVPSVNALAFAADGVTLAVGTNDGQIQFWDIRDITKRKPWASVAGHKGSVNCLAFSPDGKTLATGGSDGILKLWDLGTRKERLALQAHRRWVSALLYSADGASLISAGEDKSIHLWDLPAGKLRFTLHGHSADTLALSTDSKRLASGSSNNIVKLWDLGARRELHTWETSPHVCFSRDGRCLISSGNQYVKVWDVTTGRRLAAFQTRFTFPHVTQMSPDGKTLAAGLDDGRLVLWDVETLLTPAK